MKKIEIIFILLVGFNILLAGSKNQNDSLLQNNSNFVPIQNTHRILITDSTKYDHRFIDEIVKYNEPITLTDSLIITGADTIHFPHILKLNKIYTFTAKTKNKLFTQKIERINLTNLKYSFEISNLKHIISERKSGIAILQPFFFLGSEKDYDTELNENYDCAEYWDYSNDGYFSIRVGYRMDNLGKFRVKISYSYKKNNGNSLELDDCPVLRSEE